MHLRSLRLRRGEAAAAPTARLAPLRLNRCAAAEPAAHPMSTMTPAAAWRGGLASGGGRTARLPPLLLQLLLLLSVWFLCLWLPSLVVCVLGAACPSNTYNDGFAYIKDGGGFNIADPGFSLAGRSFTMEVWLKRDQNTFMCWMAQGQPGTIDQLLAFCSGSKVKQQLADTRHTPSTERNKHKRG